MRSSQAARGPLPVAGVAELLPGAALVDSGLEAVAVVPASLTSLSLSVAAFLAARDDAAFDAANADRATVTGADATRRVADAAAGADRAPAGGAACSATAGADAGVETDNGGAALLAGDMAAAGSGAGLEPNSNLNVTAMTASKAAPAINHRAFLGASAGAA